MFASEIGLIVCRSTRTRSRSVQPVGAPTPADSSKRPNNQPMVALHNAGAAWQKINIAANGQPCSKSTPTPAVT